MIVFEFFQGLKTVNKNKHCSFEDKKNNLLCKDMFIVIDLTDRNNRCEAYYLHLLTNKKTREIIRNLDQIRLYKCVWSQ
jgi:hypothetical protein